jgi:hypothetical protein
MRPNPSAVQFVVTAHDAGGAARTVDLWLVCAAETRVPLRFDLGAVEPTDIESVAEQVTVVAAGAGLVVLEDPRRQLTEGRSVRASDPVVQRAIASSHAAGDGTYRQLAEHFGLADATEARAAISAGATLLESEPAPTPPERSTRPAPTPLLPGEPTEPQLRKFAQFERIPERDDVLAAVGWYARLAGLLLEDLGVTWGVTVCVAANTLARVNVGPREALGVYRHRPAVLYGFGRPPVLPPGTDLELRHGYAQVPESFAVLIPRRDGGWPEPVVPGLRDAARAFVRSQARQINPTFHNPLVTPAIEDCLRQAP